MFVTKGLVAVIGILIGLALFALATAIHFEAFHLIASALPRYKMSRRGTAALVMTGVVLAHLVEIIVFAFAYFALYEIFDVPGFSEEFEPTYNNYFFHSATSYTTLGISDFSPTDVLKLVTVIEALAGFTLITSSATFVYSAIGRFWRDPEEK